MPEKIKDMRNRNEDILRLVEDSYSTAQTFNPNLSSFYQQAYANQSTMYASARVQTTQTIENHDFEEFLNLIGDFYSKDPLKLELCLNFWIADSEMNPNMASSTQKPSQKQISLYKFVRYFLSGDTLIGCLYIAYVNMLTGLCTGEQSSQHCFLLLQNNSHFYDSHGPRISWNHIINAFEKYYDSFRMDLQNLMNIQQQQQTAVYNYQTPSQIARSNKGITQQELQGLISVTKLVKQISVYNERARSILCEYQRADMSLMTSFNTTVSGQVSEQNFPTVLFGLLTCPIPISLKGEIMNLLASFTLSPQIASNMWFILENSQLLQTLSPQQQPQPHQQHHSQQQQMSTSFSLLQRHDIKSELEEVESREETYSLLKGFLNLLKNLVTHTNIPENLGLGVRPKNAILGFQPYLHFLVNHVYLKVLYRSYKNIQEKWQIASYILEIFYQIIQKYEVQSEDFSQSHQQDPLYQITTFKSPISNSSGYRLIYDFIHDGPIVRMLFVIMSESLAHLLEYNLKNDEFIELTSLTCLKLVSLVIEKQKLFIDKMKMANLNIESSGIEKLIISLNPATNRAEYFMSILRFIQFNSTLVHHSYYALNIVYMLSNYSLINTQLLNLFLKSCLSLNEQFELMHSFVEFLEYDESTEISREDNLYLALKNNLESIDINDSNTTTSNMTYTQTQTQSQTQPAGSNLNQTLLTYSNQNDEMRSASRLKALKLLLYYLRLQAPNIAHLLLGFDINKPLKNQQFFNPGTKINYSSKLIGNKELTGGSNDAEILSIVPRNCLHSIIRILNKFLREPILLNKMASTIDFCYEILFILCSNFHYNQQLLNYLRNEFDFINLNLKRIPLHLNDLVMFTTPSRVDNLLLLSSSNRRTLKETTELKNDKNTSLLKKFKSDHLNEIEDGLLANNHNQTSLYSIYSWIIQLTCIEIQNLISNRMKTHLKKLVQILSENTTSQSSYSMKDQNTIQNNNSKIFSNSNFDSLIYLNNSSSNYQSNRNKTLFGDSLLMGNLDQTKPIDLLNSNTSIANLELNDTNKLFQLIQFMSFSQETPDSLNLNYFDPQLIEKVIDTCKYTPEFLSIYLMSSIQLYDLNKLKQILIYEIRETGVNISRSNLLNEIRYILENVYERNRFQLSFVFKKKYFESLKLLIETFVLLTPCDVFNLNQRYSFLVQLMKRLFQSLNQENLIVELTYSVSSILFILITNLRQVVTQLKKQQQQQQSILNDSNLSSIIQQQTSYSFNMSNITDIFKKLVEYLLNNSLTNFKVRTHLYASILNYLMIFEQTKEAESDQNQSMMSLNKLASQNIEYYENIKILLANMNTLLKIICTDSCEGLNITTMMGLSLLNKIIDLDSNNTKWIKYLSDNGYITCIINSISNTDNQLLEESFHSQMRNDKVVYIFETKMALFLSMSKTSYGAELLVKHGLVNCLISCSVFNLRIKFDRNLYSNRNSAYLVQLLNQYYQLFFPILNLFISILNTMGSSNIEIKSQISKFILSHSECILHILTSKIGDLNMLEEIKLITCLLSKLAPFDNLKFENLASNFTVEYNSVFSRIHKEFLNLICLFFVPDQLRQLKKEIEHHTHQEDTLNLPKTINSFLAEISSNISSYCTSIMKVGQLNIPFLIFSPKIENHQLHPYSPTMMRMNSKHLQLGLLIDFLKFSFDNLERAIEVEIELNSKYEHIQDLIEIEKKQLVGEYKLYEKMSENEKQSYLRQQLKNHLKLTKFDITNFICTIERSILILWRHIEFYLTNMDMNTQSFQLFKNDLYMGESLNDLESLKRSKDKLKTSGQITKDDFVKFRQDLIATLNQNFFKKCNEIEMKIGQRGKDNFLGVLSKRIQRIIHLQAQSIH